MSEIIKFFLRIFSCPNVLHTIIPHLLHDLEDLPIAVRTYIGSTMWQIQAEGMICIELKILNLKWLKERKRGLQIPTNLHSSNMQAFKHLAASDLAGLKWR